MLYQLVILFKCIFKSSSAVSLLTCLDIENLLSMKNYYGSVSRARSLYCQRDVVQFTGHLGYRVIKNLFLFTTAVCFDIALFINCS